MLLRLLFLISLLGYATGPDAREQEEDDKIGGEGFGAIVILFVAIGAIILLTIVVMAILALTGRFESPFMDPIT